MSNELNLPQVDYNQGVESTEMSSSVIAKGLNTECAACEISGTIPRVKLLFTKITFHQLFMQVYKVASYQNWYKLGLTSFFVFIFVCLCISVSVLSGFLSPNISPHISVFHPSSSSSHSTHPISLLQNKGSLQFEDKWDLMRPIVLKLLRQEAVTKQQWFDLFS